MHVEAISRHVPLRPLAVLRAMMDQQGLTQSELAQEPGSQGVVSEILSGKRETNLRQMRALAVRFSVPVTAFVGGASVVVAGRKVIMPNHEASISF